MPKFVCSYAHDIPCFADFIVEVESEAEAQTQIAQALREGKFATVDAEPWWENGPANERVFVLRPAAEGDAYPTLAKLIEPAQPKPS